MRDLLKRAIPLSLALILLAGCGQAGSASAGGAAAPGAGSSAAVSAPDASKPDASKPDASAPDVSAPDVSAPDASAPDVSEPEPEVPELPHEEGELPEELEKEAYTDAVVVEYLAMENEAVALADAPAAIPTYLTATAPGTLEKRNSKAVIDYSNTKDGYVMVQYTASTTKRLKAVVKGPTTQYQYNLTAGKWATLPLSDGNGSYQITVYENVQGTKYAGVVSVTASVTLADEFAPFLRSNQYVDFEPAANTIAKAQELCKDISEPLKKVEAVYNYVVKNMTYDKQLAATVQSGYLPVLDTVLEKKTGICFDYAALMTGMLRSQGVPCKLVVGYAGTAYHAWISVWSEKDGWIEGAVYFNGTSWQRMDPTFASSGKQSDSIMKYIGDGSNYSSKYFY